MKPSCLRLLALLSFSAAITGAFAADAASDLTPAPSDRALPSAAIPDRYIVQVAPGVDPRVVAAAHAVAPNFVYQRALQGFAGMVPPGRLAALRGDPRVLHVVPDRVVAAIAKPTAAGGKTTDSSQVLPKGVERIGAAPGGVTQTGVGVGVAVVDTGVDFAHPDLTVSASSFTGYGSSAQDQNGHGTHVAGTIAALDNDKDVVGVAPRATIYAVRVLDASGSGSDSVVTAGLEWVAKTLGDNPDVPVSPPIRVVNMSLGRAGSLGDNPAMRTAIQTLVAGGIAVVVAAGNDARLEVSQQVPATYPEVIAVASTTAAKGTSQYRSFPDGIPADTASYFTTDGAYVMTPNGYIGVTVSAPGEDQENISKAGFIQSVGILSTKLGGGTTRMSGTSMAAPHVAGVAALIYEKNSSVAPEDLRLLIRGGAANPLAPLDSPTSSYSFDGAREGVIFAPNSIP